MSGSTATEMAEPPALFTAMGEPMEVGSGLALNAANGITSVPIPPKATTILALSGEIDNWCGAMPAREICCADPVVRPVEGLMGMA